MNDLFFCGFLFFYFSQILRIEQIFYSVVNRNRRFLKTDVYFYTLSM